jgi:phosphate transport system substrate-binding protein
MKTRTSLGLLGSIAILVLAAAGCGGDDSSTGTITADGSSTVGPFTTRAAEDFRDDNPDVQITVGISGTGGGFERFCVGETDISNASRAIDDDEKATCEENGVEYVELQVATDALTNVVNSENDWASCLTVERLNAIWKPGSKVSNWNQVDPSFPDVALKLYGAGTDSGTFDYFTGAINGEEGASRSDFSPTEDDNVTVQGVSGDKGALGYFGFSYYEENAV